MPDHLALGARGARCDTFDRMAFRVGDRGLFFHIPKTGGTWVQRVLREFDIPMDRVYRQHGDMEEVRWYRTFHPFYPHWRQWRIVLRDGLWYPAKLEKCFKFCFVRNPYSYYESFWKFKRQAGWRDWGQPLRGARNWHPHAEFNGISDDDFNRWMEKVIERRPGYVTRLYQWYCQDGMDRIGRLENIAEDLSDVLGVLGYEFDAEAIRRVAPENVSDQPRRAIEWDEAIKDEIYKLDYWAFSRFGYPREWPEDERRLQPVSA